MKKLTILLMFLTLMNGLSLAQTNIKIMDIVVTPMVNIDTVTGEQSNPDITELSIMFKINNVSEASKAYILFGTSQDTGDVLTVQADFVENSGTYYLSYNGNQNPVNGYTAHTVIELTGQQESDYKYITLYIEDINGQDTDKLYFIK